MIFTNEQFRIEILKYLDQHWTEKLLAEDVATVYGYSVQYFNIKFKECFGIPFIQYFTKLKLRRAAKEIIENNSLTNMGRKAGYSNPQSFSKAFRNEFGVSPKQFLESELEIPDMPICCTIYGLPIQVNYVTTEKTIVHGDLISPINGNKTDMKKEVGYYFDHINKEEILEDGEEKIEMWWHDENFNMQYIIGNRVEREDELAEGRIQVILPEDYYAEISVKLLGGVQTNHF